jgi:SNF2 family DNA or RNA helicase
MTYGRIDLHGSTFQIECEPHVALRLKRMFAKVNKNAFGKINISATPENCRELEWFILRYPLQLAHPEMLRAGADQHRAMERAIAAALEPDYVPPSFDLALPPREYQRVAADLAIKTGGLLVADDVGLGKTVTAICALSQSLPALVVTLAHLPRQWQEEIKRFAPKLKTYIVKKGSPSLSDAPLLPQKGEQGAIFSTFPDVVLINYHKLRGWSETLAGRFSCIVFDEVQELRRQESGKYNAAAHLVKNAKLRMGLSATPIYNYGAEIWSVLNIVRPGALGTESEFRTEWCGFSDRIKEPKVFGAYVRDAGLMIRRTRRDVGRELPPLSKFVQHVDSDSAALDRLGDSATELARIILRATENVRGEKMQAAAELDMRVRQATGIAKAPYVADFVRLLIESGEKVLLYGWHREVYSIWQSKLADLKPLLFTGSESPVQKETSRQAFLNGDSPLILMSLRAGAGIDGLQHKCRTVVFGELDWSPGVHEQCTGRIYRDGQPDPVMAYYLVSDEGSDPIVVDVLGLKRQQIEGLRDPNGALVEKLEVDPSHIRKLAESLLSTRGELVDRLDVGIEGVGI